MQLVKKMNVNIGSVLFSECDDLCFKSKNLYNSILYIRRNHYFTTKENLNYASLYKLIKNLDVYKELPAKVGNQVNICLDNTYKSYFQLLKMKTSGSYSKNVNLPRYLDSHKGRYVTIYEKGAINQSKKQRFNNVIQLSKTNIVLPLGELNKNDINQVRIVPHNKLLYKIEIVYTKQLEEQKNDNGNYASIDFGINNLMTVAFNNKCHHPLIINGKPIKSINRFYNKQKSKKQRKLKGRKQTSNAITKLGIKRDNKINDYFHKASTLFVNHLVSIGVNTLIIGYNKGWKQDINIGKKNNQKFVSIPYHKLKFMLEYKCKLNGINVIISEESYTSKCSFVDNEPIEFRTDYKGKRIKRGLFQTENKFHINADLNGALNIMKKVVPNAFSNGIEGLTVSPKVLVIR